MANRGGFTRGMRQRKHWHGIKGATVNFTASATAILGSFSLGERDPYTILRMLGQLLVWPTGGGTFVASDEARLTFGFGRMSADAVALGASAMPDPSSEPDYPWLWWYSTTVNFEGSADAPGQEIAMTDRGEINSKAMRKIGPRQSLALIVQYTDINGSPPLSVDAGCRFLIGT